MGEVGENGVKWGRVLKVMGRGVGGRGGDREGSNTLVRPCSDFVMLLRLINCIIMIMIMIIIIIINPE